MERPAMDGRPQPDQRYNRLVMPLFSSILCAVDHSMLAPRVLRHAVGFAAAFGAKLTVLTVQTGDTMSKGEAELRALWHAAIPAGAPYSAEPRFRVIRVAQGSAADAVLECVEPGTDLLVGGTHARSGLSRWVLGSNSAALLDRAPCPILLIPPGDTDIVHLDAAGARLDTRTVLVAVDSSRITRLKLSVASELASRAGRPVLLLTVAGDGREEAERALAVAGRSLAPLTVQEMVVPQGEHVGTQIAGVAVAQHAGLVVMGVRSTHGGLGAELASEILRTKSVAVLGVPAGWTLPTA
jgi:nucleotide-binding universal stress UspA family protein